MAVLNDRNNYHYVAGDIMAVASNGTETAEAGNETAEAGNGTETAEAGDETAEVGDETAEVGDENYLVQIDGDIMPLREGTVSEGTGIDRSRILRGEDICFLLEAYQSLISAWIRWDTPYSGEGRTNGDYPLSGSYLPRGGIAFTRKVTDTQVVSVENKHNSILGYAGSLTEPDGYLTDNRHISNVLEWAWGGKRLRANVLPDTSVYRHDYILWKSRIMDLFNDLGTIKYVAWVVVEEIYTRGRTLGGDPFKLVIGPYGDYVSPSRFHNHWGRFIRKKTFNDPDNWWDVYVLPTEASGAQFTVDVDLDCLEDMNLWGVFTVKSSDYRGIRSCLVNLMDYVTVSGEGDGGRLSLSMPGTSAGSSYGQLFDRIAQKCRVTIPEYSSMSAGRVFELEISHLGIILTSALPERFRWQ